MKKILILQLIFLVFLDAKSLRDLYQDVEYSIVTVATEKGSGSGFYVDTRLIVTNYHVIDGVTNGIIIKSDESRSPFEVVMISKRFDLALLKVDTRGVPLKLGKCKEHRIGDEIAAIGSPFGQLTGTLSSGIISQFRNEPDKEGLVHHFIQFTAPISAGNSGGPLMNMDGKVIGVNAGIVEVSGNRIGQNLNFAIAITHVKDLITEYETKEPLHRWKKLSELGSNDATYSLAMEYLLVGDCTNAKAYLEKAALAGYKKAQNRLGLLRYEGVCYEKDIDASIKIFQGINQDKKICEIENIKAKYMAANILFYDKIEINDALRDYEKISDLYNKCRLDDKGYELVSYASYMAGYIYEFRNTDFKKAKVKYELASKFGYKKATERLEGMELN